MPHFSVVVPVHNKEAYLNRCLTSVLKQSFTDFELILIDDASSDGSLKILKSFKDSRVKILERNTPGPAGNAAREYGINSAKGEFIAFLDADDRWHEDFLMQIFEATQKYPDVEFFCSGYEVNNGNETRESDYYMRFNKMGSHIFTFEEFLIFKPCHTSSTVIRKDFLIDHGGFYKGDKYRCGDVETWLRIMASSKKGYWVNYIGSTYYNMIPGSVIHTIPSYLYDHPVRQLVKCLIRENENEELIFALKKHSNSFILTTLKHRVKSGNVSPLDFKALFFIRGVLKERVIIMFTLSFLPRWMRKRIFNMKN